MARQSQKRKKKSEKNGLFGLLTKFAAISLVVYAVVIFISQQADLAEKEQELSQIRVQIEEAKGENAELEHLVSLTDEDVYMERIAIERLGYAYPDEIRFYVMNGN